MTLPRRFSTQRVQSDTRGAASVETAVMAVCIALAIISAILLAPG
jgi:Flp pilus assembly pilin Flp